MRRFLSDLSWSVRQWRPRPPRRGSGGGRPWLTLSALGAAALLVLGGVWVAATALMARGELNDVRADAPLLRSQLTAADISAATITADSMAAKARRAHHLTRGPAWAVLARVPVLGEPFKTARGITAAADELGSTALPRLVAAGTEIDPDKLRGDDGRIDVEALRRVAPAVDEAAASINRAADLTRRLPGSTWLGSVDSARTDVLEQLEKLAHVSTSAQQAAKLLPPMLGADGRRTYFVAFQNNAEARGTGGLPGAFAIVRVDNGEIEFRRFESDTFLAGVSANVKFDKEYRNLYRNAATTTLFLNSNLSPHFPYAAQIWKSMYEKKTGKTIDGALALDPAALSYLLAVTGPATLADGTAVTAGNVVELTQSTAYTKFTGGAEAVSPEADAARRAFLIQVAGAVADKITSAQGDATGLARALAKAAHERRLLVWSGVPDEQAELEETPLSGSVPVTKDAYAGMTIINEGGNKLDYYLDRKLLWERSGCGLNRDVTVTVTLTNTAPAGLNNYVASRSDRRDYEIEQGDHRVVIWYAATTGAQLKSVTLDGKTVGAAVGYERGHPVFQVDVELPRGKPRTAVLNLSEPRSANKPIVLEQPLVRPLSAEVRDRSCL